jgi:hypothetical protein
MALEASVSLDGLADAAATGRVEALVLPLDLPVRDWPSVDLDERQAQDLQAGRAIPLDIDPAGGRARAYAAPGLLLALLRHQPADGRWHPFRVFPTAPAEEEAP